MLEHTYNAMRKAIIGLQMIWQITKNLSSPNTTTSKTTPKKINMQRAGSAGRVIKTITCAVLTQSTTATRHDTVVQTSIKPNDTAYTATTETGNHQKARTIQVAFSHGEELGKLVQQPWEGKEFWPTKNFQGAKLKEPTTTPHNHGISRTIGDM